MLAGRSACQVAGVKLQVAAGRKRRSDLCKRGGFVREVGIVQHVRAELDRAGRAVPDERDRGEAGEVVRRQDAGDLLQAVARRIEHIGDFARREAAEQVRKVRNIGIDENDLLRDDALRVVARHDFELPTPAGHHRHERWIALRGCKPDFCFVLAKFVPPDGRAALKTTLPR